MSAESIANRDAALECVDIARAALRAGDHARAERFANKALKLYRCEQVSPCLCQRLQRSGLLPGLAHGHQGALVCRLSPSRIRASFWAALEAAE